MIRIVLILLFLVKSLFANELIVSRNTNESLSDFVERVSLSKVHQANQMSEFDGLLTGKNTIIAFTEKKDLYEDKLFDIELNVFKNIDVNKYSWSKMKVCEQEGGAPTLRSFFYVNLNNSINKSIGVICGWDASHASDCPQIDEVHFYKIDHIGKIEPILVNKKNEHFYGVHKIKNKTELVECDFSKFKKANDVKLILKNIKL